MKRINILEKVEHILKSLPDENKPWKKNVALVTNHFNFGFNEETWIKYSERRRLVNNPNSTRVFQRSTSNQPTIQSLPPNSRVPSTANICSNPKVEICVDKSTPVEDLRSKILSRNISIEKQSNGHRESLQYRSSYREERNQSYNSRNHRFYDNYKRNNKAGMYSDRYDDTKGYNHRRSTDNWQSDNDSKLNAEIKLKGRNPESLNGSMQNSPHKRKLESRTHKEYRAPSSASSNDDDDNDCHHHSRNKKPRKAYYEHDLRQNLRRERSRSNELVKKSESRRREEYSKTLKNHRDAKKSSDFDSETKDHYSRNKRRDF